MDILKDFANRPFRTAATESKDKSWKHISCRHTQYPDIYILQALLELMELTHLRAGASVTKGTLRTSRKVRDPQTDDCRYVRVNTDPVRLADIISTVEFDQTGNYLATGDKGGRVVLFERNETV